MNLAEGDGSADTDGDGTGDTPVEDDDDETVDATIKLLRLQLLKQQPILMA